MTGMNGSGTRIGTGQRNQETVPKIKRKSVWFILSQHLSSLAFFHWKVWEFFGISNLKQTRNILTYSFPFKLREKELTRFPLVFP
jgi:hypothetical protein